MYMISQHLMIIHLSTTLFCCTVLVQIFEGCKFPCFHGQMVIHKIFILEISLFFVNGKTDSRLH